MKRGRKSGADLTVVPIAHAIKRPDPPCDLTGEEADVWRTVVNRLPADWVPVETWPLLTQHCRHVVTARRCAQLVHQTEAATEFDAGEYDKLLAMQGRETTAVIATARALRLTQQSRLEPRTAFRDARDSVPGPKPWDY